LPGKTVTGVTGYVTSAFGNSGAYTVTATLALANTALLAGAGTTGHVAIFDAGGKLVDAGAPPALFWSIGFLVGWNGGDATGTDLAGHRPIPVDATPVKLHIRCMTAPATAAQTIDLICWRGGAAVGSLLAAPLALSVGSLAASTTAFATGISLQAGDYVTIDSSQTGGTPAANLFVELLLQ
jgi:hypothetical protein